LHFGRPLQWHIIAILRRIQVLLLLTLSTPVFWL
jgi:hypothetical protein